MKNRVVQGLLKSDIYGYPVTLNFKKNTKYRTVLGGVLSLITIATIVVLAYNSAISLINRENDYLSQQTIVQFSPVLQEIQFSDFTFFLQVVYDGHKTPNVTEKQFLNVTLRQIRQQKELEEIVVNSRTIPMKSCTIEDFQQLNNLDFSEQFTTIGLEQYLCPDMKQSFNLSGHPSSQIYDYLQIRIDKCIDVNQCLQQDELGDLIDLLQTPHFSIKFGFTNSYLDTEAKNLQPFIYETSFFASTENQYTKTDVLVRQTNFIEDKSIIPYQNDFKTNVFYNVPENGIKTQTISIYENGTLADIFITLGQEQTQIRKSYYRLDTFLAYVGGILQTSVFILAFVIGNYNRFAFYVSLANRLYTFDVHPSKTEQYKRQQFTDESTIFTLNELQQRIRDRVERVKNAIQTLQKGTKLLITSNRISQMFKSVQQLEKFPSAIQRADKSELGNKQTTQEPDLSFNVASPIEIEPGEVSNEYDNQVSNNSIVQSVRVSQIHARTPPGRQNLKNQRLDKKKLSVKFFISEDSAQKKELERFSSAPVRKSSPSMIRENRHEFLQESFKDMMKYSQHIRMTGMYLVSMLLCKRLFFRTNERLQLIHRAVKMLKRDTDIVSILDKLQDIDKFKKILLTKEQIRVFDYTPKPVVRAHRPIDAELVKFQVDEQNKHMRMATQDDYNLPQRIHKQHSLLRSKKKFKSMKSYFKLYKAYDKLYHQNEDDIPKADRKMNNKLMHLIGDELRDVFEISYYLEEQPTGDQHHHHHHHHHHHYYLNPAVNALTPIQEEIKSPQNTSQIVFTTHG